MDFWVMRLTVQTNSNECNFLVMWLNAQNKMVLTFASVHGILKCDHSYETYWAVLSCDAVYYAVQGGSSFWVCGWNPKVWLKWKLLSSTFLSYCLLCDSNYLLSLWKCGHSNESYWAVLSCDAVYYAVQGRSHSCVCGRNPKVWPFKWKLLSSTFLWCFLLCCTRWL